MWFRMTFRTTYWQRKFFTNEHSWFTKFTHDYKLLIIIISLLISFTRLLNWSIKLYKEFTFLKFQALNFDASELFLCVFYFDVWSCHRRVYNSKLLLSEKVIDFSKRNLHCFYLTLSGVANILPPGTLIPEGINLPLYSLHQERLTWLLVLPKFLYWFELLLVGLDCYFQRLNRLLSPLANNWSDLFRLQSQPRLLFLTVSPAQTTLFGALTWEDIRAPIVIWGKFLKK